MAVSFPWKWLIGFVILVALSFTLFQVADVGLGQAGTETLTQQNETLVVTFDNDVHVSNSPENNNRYVQGFEDDEVIRNGTGGELTEGTDYEWNTTDGGVTFFDTSNLTDSEDVTITYNYSRNVEEVREGDAILQVIVEAVPLWVLIPAALFFAGLFVWLAYLVKGALSASRRVGTGRR